jgi:hypothetical protein
MCWFGEFPVLAREDKGEEEEEAEEEQEDGL